MDFIVKLKQEWKAFSDDLDPKYILTSLYNSNVLSPEEHERIKSKDNKPERFKELFSLLTDGSRTFNQLKLFVDALEEKDEEGCLPYPWLAEKLKPAFQLDEEVHRILVRGNVRLPVNHLLPREKKVQLIRKKLIESSDQENPLKWVVLHGPIGSGKSSLAAESLRVNDLRKYFPHGVYWLNFGGNKMNCTDRLAINSYDKKIVNILKLLNDNYKFSPGDDFNYLLRRETLSKKVLFILDEICDKRIIDIFNIDSPILVTTTLKNILDHVSCYSEFIECSNDAEDSDIKLLLSKYVGCKAEKLPKIAQEVCSKCRGSLLVASLIGGSMSSVGNDEETWNYWNKKLDENGLAGLEKFEENDVLKVIINCIEHINVWKEYYFDLVIFKKGFDVPSEVLKIMWGTSAVFQIAVQLYKRSFAVIKESESGSQFLCCSHDLYVDAVSRHLGKEEIKERHKKFVKKILEHGRTFDGTFDLTKLPKNYIPSFIDYHLYEAGEFEELEQLYLDLKFVEQKIRLMDDSRSILNDYQFYKSCFKNKEVAKSFELFLEKKGRYLLCEEKCDIIQLALFEPNDSIVYKKAKEYANKNGGIYYEWCNKMESIHKFFDYEIIPCSSVKFGAINGDASLVAFVDDFKSEENGSEYASWVKLWYLHPANVTKENSHADVLTKNSHADVINYCAFSSKGDYLATASADTTVKIYKIKDSFEDSGHAKSFLPFKHDFDVVCCSFSNDDRYVMSSDIIGNTLVWKFDVLGERAHILMCSFFHSHELKKEPFRFSSFSNDGKTIGTSVYDTIKLWDFKTRKEKKSFCCDNKIIKKFIFSNDDSHILLVQDYAVLFWDIENDDASIIFSDDSCAISSCCLSTSGKYIACGMESGCIIITTKEGQKILPKHDNEILNVMFSKDETKLFSVSPNCCIIYNVNDIETIPLISGNLSVVMNEELTIASTKSSYSVLIMKGQVITETNLKNGKISAFSLSRDGSEIFIGTECGSVKVFNIIEKNTVELFPKHCGKITYILPAKINHSFFTCSVDATINVWRGEQLHITLSGHKLPIVMCVEFKTCNRLLTCCEDSSLRVWDTDVGNCIYSLESHRDKNITYCDIACDDEYLAAAFTNGHVMIWKAESGNLYKTFFLPPEVMNRTVRCCQISPLSEMVIAGLDNGNVVLCHLLGPETCDILNSRHESAVHTIRRINGDDTFEKPLFLSASKCIKLWNSYGHLVQTILFPNSTMADEPPKIWSSDNFDVFVVIINSILYILKRID